MRTDECEIVRVIDQCWLVDSESYQRRYRGPAGRPLVPGCYVVVHSEDAPDARYDEGSTYIGPFASARGALAAITFMTASTRQALTPTP